MKVFRKERSVLPVGLWSVVQEEVAARKESNAAIKTPEGVFAPPDVEDDRSNEPTLDCRDQSTRLGTHSTPATSCADGKDDVYLDATDRGPNRVRPARGLSGGLDETSTRKPKFPAFERMAMLPERLEHHLGGVLCLQSAMWEEGDYDGMLACAQDIVDILSGSLLSVGTSRKTATVSLDRLMAHPEVSIRAADQRDLGKNENSITFGAPGGDPVAPSLVRSHFVFPFLDLVALNGTVEASFRVTSDGLALSAAVQLHDIRNDPHGQTSLCRSGQRAAMAAALSLIERRAMAVDLDVTTRLENTDGLDVTDACHEPRGSRQVLSLTACLAVAVGSVPPDALTKQVQYGTGEAPSDSLTRRPKLLPQLSREKYRLEAKSRVVFFVVEDQAIISNMVTKCARVYGGLDQDSVQAIVSPEDVRGTRLAILRALERPHVNRVVVSFDENIYSLDSSLTRVAYTGTRLRDDIFQVAQLRQAHDSKRLVFACYSSSKIDDARIHVHCRKGTDTPRGLVLKVVSYLNSMPLLAA